MITLGHRHWLTSQELVKWYGLQISPGNASRTAKNIIRKYNLPWHREGYKWFTTDPFLLAQIHTDWNKACKD